MYKHILFATDLTEDTEYLINKVEEIHQLVKGKLSLVNVVEPLPGFSYAYMGFEDVEGQLIDDSRKKIEILGERLKVAKDMQHVEVGPTKTKVLGIADEIGADLIVCGSHGRHGLSLLLGSTANAILHGAKCDVLTVRLPEEE